MADYQDQINNINTTTVYGHEFSASFMSKDPASYDIQRSNNFYVEVYMTPRSSNVSAPVANMATGATSSPTATTKILGLAIEAFPLPKVSISPIELPYQNGKCKVAGQPSLEDFSMTLRDFTDPDGDVEALMYQWMKLVYDPATGKMGNAGDYKFNARLFEYDASGSSARIWWIEGLWPNNVDYGSMDFNSADKKQISVTLSADRAFRIS